MRGVANEFDLTILDAVEQLLTTKDVCRVVSLSRQELWRRRREGTFPEPVKLGPRRVGFRREEIEAWLQARITERDERAKP